MDDWRRPDPSSEVARARAPGERRHTSDDPDRSGFDDDLVVPRPSWSRADLVAWLRWIGVARALATLGTVVVGAAVAWWLLRPPAAPTEALLPRATTSSPGGVTSAGIEAAGGATTAPVATTEAGPPGTIVVHVAGAVERPGIVVLVDGSRVADAIAAGGGPLADGELDRLNLAAPLADGDRIEVPEAGAVDAGATPLHVAAGPSGSAATEVAIVDVNTATASELETLPGVGTATATAIVEHRQSNGPFLTVDDLDAVAGIGPAKLEQLRVLVTV